jgi:hypothetical protein
MSAADPRPSVPDTFGVGVHVTDDSLRLVVRVPTDVDSGWRDREAFQRRVERVVWDELDREATLRAVARGTPTGETRDLGTVTLSPDGTVHGTDLASPPAEDGP